MSKQANPLVLTASLLSLAIASSSAFAVSTTQQIEDALNFHHYGKNGAVKFDLNYRYENVNEDNRVNAAGVPLAAGLQPKTAHANTARLRLGYLTPKFHDFQGYAEYEGNLQLEDEYNSTRNFNTAHSVVADPDFNEINQLWFTYTGIADNVLKVGRQRIKLDDDRYIGNVGWRQMEMTYDALLWTHNNQTLFGLVANVGYIGSIQTITSTTEHVEAPFLNLNYKMGDYGNLVGYGYWLDYTDIDSKALMQKSSQTYGLRATCCLKPLDSVKISENFGLAYTAEWAHQSDYGHGSDFTKYDVDRWNLMGGISAYNIMFQGAMEQLGGGGVDQHFDTPLGTNHAFQGWADLFLTTPNNGIRDVFGTVMVPFQRGDLVISTIYHDFSDDTGRFDYGSEWDFQAVQKFGKHYSILAKYATFNAGENLGGFTSTDTQKLWLQGNINF
ncbi:hypothetical protein JCM14076_09150 [Methylosoma difficile]